MKKFLVAVVGASLIALASTFLGQPVAYAVDDVVPDPGFAKCLNRILGQADTDPISSDQLAGITSDPDVQSVFGSNWNAGAAYCPFYGIVSLEGAQYLTGITGLYLYQNQVGNLSPLAGLTNLSYLYLDSNQISSVSDLSGLQNLSRLYLSNNKISDISGLSGMTSLEYVDLTYNQISAVPPLTGLPSLKYLYLSANQITNVAGLAGLTSLETLYVDANQVSDISALANLQALVELNLNGNAVNSISALSGLHPRFMILNNNQIDDVSPLKQMLTACGSSCPNIMIEMNLITDISMLPQVHASKCNALAYECFNGVSIGGQAAKASAAVGVSQPAPKVLTNYKPVKWTVLSGDATVNADGTITYRSAGTVELEWTDASTYSQYNSITNAWYVVPNFSGNYTVEVSGPSLPMKRFTLSPDMTGDRRGEVLAVDSVGELWLFPGTATGQMGNPMGLASGFADQQIAAPGDVNSDGKADVLAIDSAGYLFLYPGNGSKAVGSRKQVGNGWTGWRLIPAGDLSGDGKADLLSIDSLGDLYMYAGKGDGTFGMKKKVGNGWNGWDLYSAGDLNGDGKTDILGIDSVGNLYQYAGKGDGTFQMKVQAGNGWIGYTLAAGGDLNGDGLADITGLDGTTHTLYVYLGKGNAMFAMKKIIASGW